MAKVGIVGGTGYTGSELMRLLVTHPDVKVECITSRSDAGKPVSSVFSNLHGYTNLDFVEPDIEQLKTCDLVFYATPNGTAMQQTPDLLEAGVKVVDLAADFRIKDIAVWQHWYGMTHACPDLVAEAVYGLPEVNRDQVRSARLVANPGCYPTAVTLGFLPLIENGLVDLGTLVADAKSGVSGAGKGANAAMLMGETGESFKAYGVAGHRHQPEISQNLAYASGAKVDLTFVAHLVPMIRGIEATLYADVKGDIGDLQSLYVDRYANEPFVQVLPEGGTPETRHVRGSNHCQMAVYRPLGGNKIVVTSVIDNLVKGAAGQAIQNMNLMLGLDERAGLEFPGMTP